MANLVGDGLQVRGEGLSLVLEVAHRHARLAQGLEPSLAVRQRGAQVRHPLGDRFQAAPLEIEPLDGLLRLLRHRAQLLAALLGAPLDLALELGDLAGALDDRLVKRPQRPHLLLQRAEALLVLLLLPHARVDLAHGPLQFAGLCERAVGGLALRFERDHLVAHEIGRGLQRADLAPDLVDRILHSVHPLHGLLDAGHAPLLVLQGAAEIVAAPLERLHLGHRELVRVDQAVVLLAHADQMLTGPVHLPAERLGVAAQLLERSLDFQERREPILEIQRDIDLLAEILEQRANALCVLKGSGDLGLDALLALRQAFGALFQTLNVRGELRQPGEPLLQVRQPFRHGVELAPRLGDGLAELLQPIGGSPAGFDERLVAAAFLLHLEQGRTHVLGEFAIFGAIPALEQGGHHTLPMPRRPLGPRGTAG